jgi:hypothetical protein
MNARQQRVVDQFKEWALAGGPLADLNRREPERAGRYEFKARESSDVTLRCGEVVHLEASTGFDVTPSEFTDTVYISATVGKVGDEDTLGSVYCRDHYHFAIGRRGGLLTPNRHPRAKRWKRVRGFWQIDRQ